ncbi:MAG: alginate lyase family protein [Bryobacteraceae bacterium]|nr:alginate lyase family protein [Bryobacteraceae bacterium]
MSINKMTRVVARIAAMSPREIRVRATQELLKRCDAAAARLGRRWLGPAPDVCGRFFFEPQQLPAIFDMLRRELPREMERTIADAERIRRRTFDLLGYRGLGFGDPIDWHLDPVHGKRSPLVPWYRIRFLDFEAAGDHKILWELNRHQHLVTLAKAWRLTGDNGFLDELIAQWRGWRAANPYPLGINWASSLEVAFRSLSWIWVERLLFDQPFAAELRAAQTLNARHIRRYLSTYFAPNTHLLGEGVALFFLGVLYGVPRWRDAGWRITLEQMEKQVRPDGFHFEQSTYYHVYALDFFLHARLLADANGIPVPAAYDAGLERMLEALAAISQADAPPRLGDDDGGRLFDPRRNMGRHMTDPLATGAVLFNRPEWNPGLTEETLWLLGGRRVGRAARTPRSTAFPDSGVYVMAAGGWQLTVDAGPIGWGNGGHGHADLLSVHLAREGREFLTDPGTASYMRAAERDWFRSTAAHNTLEVDGRSQALPAAPFAWRNMPAARVEKWRSEPAFDYFRGSHEGYAPVVHRRHVVRLEGWWLVRDEVEGPGEHDVAAWWHLGDGVHARLIPCGGWERVEQDTPRSPAYGLIAKGRSICFRTRARLPAEFAVAIIPGSDAADLEARDEPGRKIFECAGRRVVFRDDGEVEVS